MVRKHEFDIKTPIGGVPIFDLRATSLKARQENSGYKDIDVTMYGSSDGSGKKHIRNGLVMAADPMINDTPITTTNEQLAERYKTEFDVAKFAYNEQNRFIGKVIQACGAGIDSKTISAGL